MPLPFSNQLKVLVENNQLEEAIALLLDGNEWIPDDAREKIMEISTQLRQLRQKEIRGAISKEEALSELNIIRDGLIAFNESYSLSVKERFVMMVLKRIYWLVLLVILMMLILFYF